MHRTTVSTVSLVALLLAALVSSSLLLWDRVGRRLLPPHRQVRPGAPSPPDHLGLRPAFFEDLPGWGSDAVSRALPALVRSCEALARLPAERRVGRGQARAIAGTAADWRPACRAVVDLPAGDDGALRALLEADFSPFEVTDNGEEQGLFTGYYEPSLQGSRRRHGAYTVPLYLRPPELVTVDLGAFREDLEGRRIAGEVKGGTLVPFPDRAAIDGGALRGRGLELVWVDDPVAAFFLHIQGSGRIELDDGGEMRVGYAAQNGHPYRAIGRTLVTHGALAPEEVSLQSIRDWLRAHPEVASRVMADNASYVFFRRLAGPGPVGSLGVALTPERSLAVDRSFLPLGAPVWLDTVAPAPDPAAPDRPLRRLLVAQDTGGAIRGPVRGDVFWGHGPAAEAVAGRMRSRGRLWLLLPRLVAARTAPAGRR